LKLPKRLLTLVWSLLVDLNTTHSFPDPAKYHLRAKKAFDLYLKFLGPYKAMTGSLHTIITHGHLFLKWAKDVVGVPFGALTEGAGEADNKETKETRNSHARRTNQMDNSKDIMHSKMWRSCPLVLGYHEVVQQVKEGNIRRPRARGLQQTA
jgi:hypothetical protein